MPEFSSCHQKRLLLSPRSPVRVNVEELSGTRQSDALY
jgi:hypothetical protein